jgi:nucleotide-binding universal stress UspA family protein
MKRPVATDQANSLRQLQGGMYGKVLIPVDGSAASTAGVHEATKIATLQQPELRLLYIADEFHSNDTFEPGTVGWTIIETIRAEGKRILNNAANVLATYGLVAECRLIDSPGGRAASRIIREAAEWPADIIVMGTHGRRGIARLALGSSAEEVARASPIPVLLGRAGISGLSTRS